jgi:pimeloyl-ACP methyl ester carboxylesterase
MKKRDVVFTMFVLSWIAVQILYAQITPTAVTTDSPTVTKFPPELVGTTIPSHGVDMDATFYITSGAGPHGTVLLLHGLPGYESNADLAQSIRRAGWNVLLFHYRGTWGTGGTFSVSSAIEDTASAVRFLRYPVNTYRYRIDPQRLVVIGHSFGGFLAGYEASLDPDITGAVMIAAVNMGRINADPQERESRLKRWETQMHPIRGSTAPEIFAEAAHHVKDWDYVQWPDRLRNRPVLLVEADDQNHADMEALAGALRKNGGVMFDQVAMPTDHSFSDHRIALQAAVMEWLAKLKK